MKLKLFVLLCAFNVCVGAEKIENLSMRCAVDWALKNNPELRAIEMGINAALSEKKQAGRLENPVLSGEYGNDMAFKNEGQYEARISISQKFPLTGRLSKEKNISEVDVLLAKAEYANARRLLAQKVELAYINAQEKMEIEQLSAGLEDLMQNLEKFAIDAAKRGEMSPLEAAQISQESLQASIEKMTASLEAVSAISELQSTMGTELKISLSEKLTAKKFPQKNFNQELLEDRPDYKMFKLAAKNADAQIALIKANKYEDIEVGIYYSHSYETDEPFGKDRNSMLGIMVSIPLPFNSFDGSIEQKLSIRKKAEAYARAKEIEIRNEVRLLKLRDDGLWEILKKYEDSLMDKSQKNVDDFEDAYKSGNVSFLEFSKALQNFQNLKIGLINSAGRYARNASSLKYAFGTENEENEK